MVRNFWITGHAAVAIDLNPDPVISDRTRACDPALSSTQVIPHVLVLIGGIVGINVFVVLLTGIVSGAFIMLVGGHIKIHRRDPENSVPYPTFETLYGGNSGSSAACADP